MDYRYFSLKLIIRILIIFVSLLILVLAITGVQNYVTTIVFIILIAFEIIELLWYVSRINKEISQFISDIKNADYTQSFSPELTGRIFKPLRIILGEVLEDLQKAKEKEYLHGIYLQMLIDHVEAGILVFREDFDIEMQNSYAAEYFPFKANIQRIREKHPALYDFILYAEPGEKKLVDYITDDNSIQLTFRKSLFQMEGKGYVLISFQDIHTELSTTEVDSWYNLTRVLTHEIMNTVTPINSLSGSVLESLYDIREKREYNLEDLIVSSETIYKRSGELMKFVKDYKDFSKQKHLN